MNLNQFTVKAQEAVVDAQAEAVKRNHQSVEPEHLLIALLKQKDGFVPQCLNKAKPGSSKLLQSAVEEDLDKKPQVQGNAPTYLSSVLNKCLVRAEEESKSLRDDYISVEHLFLALLSLKEGTLSELFRKQGLSKNTFLEALKTARGSERVTDQDPEAKFNSLERYTRDLTLMATNGRLDPVIGRDEEIRRTIQVLSRRTKNNPVLIGDPGVGKTAIVEGLAQRIVSGDVPEGLKGKKLLSLDLGALLSVQDAEIIVVGFADFEGVDADFDERLADSAGGGGRGGARTAARGRVRSGFSRRRMRRRREHGNEQKCNQGRRILA
jgi:ATP-dependent Clp protease ATP-binding subunit ClpB